MPKHDAPLCGPDAGCLFHPTPLTDPTVSLRKGNCMASLVKDLIEAGIHFGQRRSSWNPKMSPYIFGTRNKIHIIDIRETIKGLLLAKKFIQDTVAHGNDI